MMSEELEVQVLQKSERFNEIKHKLKEFSEQIPEQSDLPTVPQEDIMLGFFSVDYGVKGKDLNALTDAVQNRMIEQNKHIKKIIQEFNTIYETFQILDEEYLQSISSSLNSAKEANTKALQGLAKIDAYQEGNNNLINDVLKQNKDFLKILKEHRIKLGELQIVEEKQDALAEEFTLLKNDFKQIEEYKHLKDEVKDLKVKLEEEKSTYIKDIYHLEDSLANLQEKFEEKQKEISFLRQGLYTLGAFCIIILLFLFF